MRNAAVAAAVEPVSADDSTAIVNTLVTEVINPSDRDPNYDMNHSPFLHVVLVNGAQPWTSRLAAVLAARVPALVQSEATLRTLRGRVLVFTVRSVAFARDTATIEYIWQENEGQTPLWSHPMRYRFSRSGGAWLNAGGGLATFADFGASSATSPGASAVGSDVGAVALAAGEHLRGSLLPHVILVPRIVPAALHGSPDPDAPDAVTHSTLEALRAGLRAEWRDTLALVDDRYAESRPSVNTSIVALAAPIHIDGDTAHVMLMSAPFEPDTWITSRGTYDYVFSKRSGSWRFVRRDPIRSS